LLFVVWVGLRLGEPTDIQRGAPWKAWGPLLSKDNLAFQPWRTNLEQLIPLLGNLLRNGQDRWGVYAVGAIVVAAWGAWLSFPSLEGDVPWGGTEALRLPALALVAFALYLFLPFDIRGYLYYLNLRYAHLFAPLAAACIPPLAARARRWFLVGALVPVSLTSGALALGFHRFQEEARPLDEMVAASAPRPVVMGLITNPSSFVCTHPVFLHAAAELARARGGTSHFSFALQPHIPVQYIVRPPLAPSSEWRPDLFRWETMGGDYDHFLLRGSWPAQVLGGPLSRGELVVVAESHGWSLLRRPASP
jgi:hypothetical protein